MPLIAVPAPFPTLTPLSSDLQQSLVQHVKSVLINKTKAEQLRPTLGHKHSESTLTHRSSISPPPDSNVLKPGRQESCAHDDVPRLDSPFIDLTQPHQTSIMTKNGIFNLYVSHATDHIEQQEASGKVSKISRARVELELLTAIDRGKFPIEYKICWNKSILSSRNFESFWLDKAKRLKLSHTCIERYNPNDTFLEYECSTPSGSEGGGSPRPSTSDQETMTDPDRMHPTQLPTPITEDDEYEDEDDDISPEAAALAHRLGGEGAPIQSPVDSGVPSFDPRGVIGLDVNGFTRETGDDGAWGSPKSKSKVKTKKSAKPRAAPKIPKAPKAPREKKAAKPRAAKRGLAAMTPDAEDVPAKKVKRSGDVTNDGTLGTGRQRKQTSKAKAIVPGQV